MKISPLFKWFGSKWSYASLLPAPEFQTVVEPFAGCAGYALRHVDRQVLLCETNPHLLRLWAWLIGTATEADIRSIPLEIPVGTDIRDLDLSDGQKLLLKNWQRTNNVGNCWTISPWGNKPGQWTASTRARVAEEVQAIRHWRILGTDALATMEDPGAASITTDATWFVDPPYQYNYRYRSSALDYWRLGQAVRGLQGQVIVCEARCPKTDAVPDWLPFWDSATRITSRRSAGQHTHSKELLWTNAPTVKDQDD